MRPTITKFSKLEPGEENTHESCAKTRQSSQKKLHAVDAILDELDLKKAPLLRSFIGL